MRGLTILCLISSAISTPQGYSIGTQHQPHQHYGPASISTSSFLKDILPVQSSEGNYATLQQQRQLGLPPLPTSMTFEQFTPPAPSNQHSRARYLAPPVLALTSSLQALPTSEADHQQFAAEQHREPEPLIAKRFFIHSAPEEQEDEEEKNKVLIVGKPRKNFNVVFIKANAKSGRKTSIKITPAANEDRTVIYVLAKKQDGSEIDAQLQEPVTATAKPEVYFIKYNTLEEAAHAQQSIQAQYDKLGGSTQVSNEGVAPVTSVIGTLDAGKQANATTESSQAEANAIYSNLQMEDAVSFQLPQDSSLQYMNTNGYLPPSKYYR